MNGCTIEVEQNAKKRYLTGLEEQGYSFSNRKKEAQVFDDTKLAGEIRYDLSKIFRNRKDWKCSVKEDL